MIWIGLGLLGLGSVLMLIGFQGIPERDPGEITRRDVGMLGIAFIGMIAVLYGVVFVIGPQPPVPCAPNCPPTYFYPMW